MNTLTIVLAMLAIIVMLAAIVWVEFKQIKKLNERKKALEASYREAQRNISYLVKHQKEIAEIKTASGEKLEEIAADGIFTFLAATGKMDAKTAVACAGSVTIIGGAVLGVCARFIPEGEQKKLAKK